VRRAASLLNGNYAGTIGIGVEKMIAGDVVKMVINPAL
jgi:hypothetical protein